MWEEHPGKEQPAWVIGAGGAGSWGSSKASRDSAQSAAAGWGDTEPEGGRGGVLPIFPGSVATLGGNWK